MRQLRNLLACLFVTPVLLLGACSGDEQPAPEEPQETETAATTSLDDVTISEDMESQPEVEFEPPFSVGESQSRVVVEGDGATAEEGQQVRVQVVTVDGSSGDVLESTWESGSPAGFPLNPEQVNPALVENLVGQTVGSRVAVAVPAEGTATAILVMDLLDAKTVPTQATGEPVEPPAGLPTVALAEDGAPTITLPEGEPPADLIVEPLKVGDGPVVEQGQTITVQYHGVIWPGGEVFDSTWENGRTAQFQIGVGQVIPGWDAGLVGQTVGSQVLLVIPPEDGYGAEGQEAAGIEGTDTLVFVVDILDAY